MQQKVSSDHASSQAFSSLQNLKCFKLFWKIKEPIYSRVGKHQMFLHSFSFFWPMYEIKNSNFYNKLTLQPRHNHDRNYKKLFKLFKIVLEPIMKRKNSIKCFHVCSASFDSYIYWYAWNFGEKLQLDTIIQKNHVHEYDWLYFPFYDENCELFTVIIL